MSPDSSPGGQENEVVSADESDAVVDEQYQWEFSEDEYESESEDAAEILRHLKITESKRWKSNVPKQTLCLYTYML